jgi:hypothetical protein
MNSITPSDLSICRTESTELPFVSFIRHDCSKPLSWSHTHYCWYFRKLGVRICLVLSAVFESADHCLVPHMELMCGNCIWLKELAFPSVSDYRRPMVHTASQRRSWPLSVSGTGIGSITYALASGCMIDDMRTSKSLHILAIISECLIFVCAWLMRDRNKKVAARYAFVDLSFLKRPRVLLLMVFSILLSRLIGATVKDDSSISV